MRRKILSQEVIIIIIIVVVVVIIIIIILIFFDDDCLFLSLSSQYLISIGYLAFRERVLVAGDVAYQYFGFNVTSGCPYKLPLINAVLKSVISFRSCI